MSAHTDLYHKIKKENRIYQTTFYNKKYPDKELTFTIYNLKGIDLLEDFSSWFSDVRNLPGTDLWVNFGKYLNSNPLSEIYLHTFDSAKPQPWVNKFMDEKGYFPLGVWSYDENKIFGSFVPYYDLLSRFTSDVSERFYFGLLTPIETPVNRPKFNV